LENILKRRNLAIADVAILNMAKNTGTDFESLVDYFSPQKILVLGEQSLPKGIPGLNLNQPKQTGNTNLLYSFSFDEMMDNPDNKRTFWEQMKNF
jgi:DNA polymerase III psi subunit